jgi:hypothetical protein
MGSKCGHGVNSLRLHVNALWRILQNPGLDTASTIRDVGIESLYRSDKIFAKRPVTAVRARCGVFPALLTIWVSSMMVGIARTISNIKSADIIKPPATSHVPVGNYARKVPSWIA